MSKFSLQLIRRRGDKQWTQQDLCDRSGVSRATIALYESGRRKPKYQSVAKLAKALGCTVTEIFPDFEDEFTETDRWQVMQEQVARLERELDRTPAGMIAEESKPYVAKPASAEAAYVADMWDELPQDLRRQILAEIVQNRYAEDNANDAKDSGN